MRRTLIAIGVLAACATGCSESGTTPSPSPPTGQTPRPEDSSMYGPLPKPGAPSTQTENPTGTGTGR